MPVKTAPGLSIRALPFQGVARAHQQMLSPSALRQPATELFALQVSTLPPLPLRKRYVVTVQRTSRLMRKSALFYDLASQYATLSQKNEDDSCGYFVSQQLPTICIEAPVRGDHAEMVDVMFEWLFADDSDGANAADTALASSLAPRIRGSQAFFALVHFATLLDLFEPYCTTIDRLLVYYYFGLSPDERRNSILRSDQFVEGVLPGRFARRLAEVVDEEEAQEMVASFFRNRQPLNAKMNGNDGYFRLSLAFDNLLSPGTPVTYDEHVLRSTALKVQTPLTATSFTTLPFVSSPVSSPVSASPPIYTPSPFDHAEPPTPRGSACMFVPPTTPSTPDIQRIFPRVQSSAPSLSRRMPSRISQHVGRVSNRAFDAPNAPATPSTPTFKATAAPPNTPATATLPAPFSDVDDSHESAVVIAVPPNTPMTPPTARNIPESHGAASPPAAASPAAASSPPTASSPLPPPTPTIKINGNDHYDADDDDGDDGNSNGKSNSTLPKRPTSGLHRASSYAFIRRELFEFAMSKIRKRASM